MNLIQQLSLVFQLLNNAALLAIGTFGYCELRHRIRDRLPGWAQSLLCGAVFGGLSIVTSFAPAFITSGIQASLAMTTVVVATLSFGAAAGTTATLVFIGYAALVGIIASPGEFVAAVALGCLVPAAAYRRFIRRNAPPRRSDLGIVGLASVVVALGMFAWLRGLPALVEGLALAGPAWVFMFIGTVVALGLIISHAERRRILEERATQLRVIVDHAPASIFLKDREGRYRLVNRHFEQWTGLKAADIIGRTDAGVVSPELARQIRASDLQVLEHGRIHQAERRKPQAAEENMLVTKFPIRDAAGTVVGIAGFSIDITERKRVELALRESHELLAESQRLGKVGYILYDVTTGRATLSDSVLKQRKLPHRAFFTFDELVAFIHPDDRERYFALRNAALAAKQDWEYEIRILHGDGSVGWEHAVGHPRLDDAGNVVAIHVVVVDISERKHAEEVLRWSEERLRALIENSNDLIVVIQPDGTISYRGPSMSEGLGYDAEDVIGHRLSELVHPDDAASVEEALRSISAKPGLHATGRTRLRHREGAWRHIAWSARNATHIPGVNGIVVNCHDVTEARILEERLQRSQKMEAVGQLAGGIAHDFNNIVGAMLGFAGFLVQDLPEDTPQHMFAERIVTAGNRARDLVQQIMAFSRRTSVERKLSDLASIIRDTRDLLEAALPSSTELLVTIQDEKLVADVNVAQISQILFNLCLNANDALASKPGQISIILSISCPGDARRALLLAEPGESEHRITIGTLDNERSYAQIVVADTGGGMAPDVLRRIFDPFFTTKERGRGTGLGLAVVHGILASYDGACTVYSRLGAGTTFTTYIPLAPQGVLLPAASEPADSRGRERVLIVDDEVDITDMLAIGLDRLGYEVATLNDPEEALAAFVEEPAAWDVVISDEVMPGMKGLTLLGRLKAIRSSLRVVLCTGFDDGMTEETALSAGVDAFFPKPVSPEQLAAGIRRLMDRPSPSADRGAAATLRF